MPLFSKRDTYSSSFIHPTSAPHAKPEDARFGIRASAHHGSTVHDFRFVSPECMEGFRLGLMAAQEMGAKVVVGSVQTLEDGIPAPADASPHLPGEV